MHVYIYDNYINEKGNDNVIARIETRITDLGLSGKIIRLGIMSSLRDAVVNELKKNPKTIVAVGNDLMLHRIVNTLALAATLFPETKNVPLGFIPVGKKNNAISKLLGIPMAETACDVLAARLIEEIGLGQAGNNYFLINAIVGSPGTLLEIDNNYTIEIKQPGKINILNRPTEKKSTKARAGIKRPALELVIKTAGGKWLLPTGKESPPESMFPFETLRIINNNESLYLDGVARVALPVDVLLSRVRLRIIVGKDRSL